jgi:hypothetical protein
MISIILANRAHLHAYMQQTLDNILYYRGDIKLSVQIGTPVLFQCVVPCLELTAVGIQAAGLNSTNSKILSEL